MRWDTSLATTDRASIADSFASHRYFSKEKQEGNFSARMDEDFLRRLVGESRQPDPMGCGCLGLQAPIPALEVAGLCVCV